MPPDPPASQKLSWVERHIGIVFLIVIVVLAIAGYSLVYWLTRDDFDMKGSVQARGITGGDFIIDGGRCDVLDKHVVGSRSDSGQITISRHGADFVVRLEPTGRAAIELSRARCTVFDAVLDETSSTYNKKRVWQGHVKASCRTGAGTIEVDLAFGKCV